jgi:hypothetical protein
MDVLSDTANAAMEVSCAYGYTTLMRCPRLGHANAVTPQGISTSLSREREREIPLIRIQISHDR